MRCFFIKSCVITCVQLKAVVSTSPPGGNQVDGSPPAASGFDMSNIGFDMSNVGFDMSNMRFNMSKLGLAWRILVLPCSIWLAFFCGVL